MAMEERIAGSDRVGEWQNTRHSSGPHPNLPISNSGPKNIPAEQITACTACFPPCRALSLPPSPPSAEPRGRRRCERRRGRRGLRRGARSQLEAASGGQPQRGGADGGAGLRRRPARVLVSGAPQEDEPAARSRGRTRRRATQGRRTGRRSRGAHLGEERERRIFSYPLTDDTKWVGCLGSPLENVFGHCS